MAQYKHSLEKKTLERWRRSSVFFSIAIFPALFAGYFLFNFPAAFSPVTPIPSPEQTAAPVMPPMPNWMSPPPTVYPPTQAGDGAQVYYLVCMACHGDRGQGLTAEWRGALDPADQNCWQSHCHASNHPPEGFILPKSIPPVIGLGVLDSYGTALDLHNFIQAKMPWQAPGSLPAEQYWQLTAYLLQQNGVGLGSILLDEHSAADLRLHSIPSPTPEVPLKPDGSPVILWIGLFGLLVLGAILLVIRLVRR